MLRRPRSEKLLAIALALGTLAAFPEVAFAGMPGVDLTDLAEMRLRSISFFLVVFLVSGWGIKLLWNGLRRDFPRLPWLSYPRALTLIALWGFLFVLVLTMISGARELMTPGAWEKRGLTYQLATDDAASFEAERLRRVEALRDALLEYAEDHEGGLPSEPHDGVIPSEVWETPDVSRMHYVYLGSARHSSGADDIIAHEPPIFSPPYFAIRRDGRIERLTRAQLSTARQPKPEERR